MVNSLRNEISHGHSNQTSHPRREHRLGRRAVDPRERRRRRRQGPGSARSRNRQGDDADPQPAGRQDHQDARRRRRHGRGRRADLGDRSGRGADEKPAEEKAEPPKEEKAEAPPKQKSRTGRAEPEEVEERRRRRRRKRRRARRRREAAEAPPRRSPKREADEADDDEPEAGAEARPKPKPRSLRRTATTDDDVPGDGHASAAAGPAVRRLARELGVELRRVRPTGDGGRITDDDVRAYVRETNEQVAATHAARRHAARARPTPTTSAACASRRCRACGRRSPATCSQSYTTIPQLTNFDDVDVTELEDMRAGEQGRLRRPRHQAHDDAVSDQGRRRRRSSTTRSSTPRSTWKSNEIIYKEYVNIGIAVDTERGLVVPVLRDADRKNIPQIASELDELADDRPRRQVRPRRPPRRHVHDQQPRLHRRHVLDADHQPAASRDPARRPQPHRCRSRSTTTSAAAADDAAVDHLRPPHRRRRRRGAVPQRREGLPRRTRAGCCSRRKPCASARPLQRAGDAGPLQRSVSALCQISLVRHAFKKGLNLVRSANCRVEFHSARACVAYITPIARNAVAHRLRERIPIRQPSLLLVADATVEILSAFGIAPEWK